MLESVQDSHGVFLEFERTLHSLTPHWHKSHFVKMLHLYRVYHLDAAAEVDQGRICSVSVLKSRLSLPLCFQQCIFTE